MSRRSPRARSGKPHACEELEGRLLFAAFTINGTTAADTINVSWHVRFIQLVQHKFVDWSLNGGATQSQDLAGFSSVIVDTTANSSGGGDTVNVLATPNVPFSVVGHSTGGFLGSIDTLNVGGANGLQDIQGPLSLSTSGVWNVTLDNSNDAAAARTATVDGSSVTGVSPSTFSWSTGISNLTLNMGSFGGSTVNVIAPSVSSLTVNGYSNAGDDTLNLGSNHTCQFLPTMGLGIAPGSPRGLWNVSLDDSADSSVTFYSVATIATGSVSGLTGSHGSIIGGQTFPNVFSWGAGSIRKMNVNLPAFVQAVVIGSVDVPVAITMNGDPVQMGQTSNGVQSITAPVSVSGTGILKIIDTNDVTSRSVLMSRAGAAVAIDGLAPATISYNLPNGPVGVPSAELDLWNNFDGGSLTVLASGQVGSQTEIVSPRTLAVSIGNASTIPDIQGVLSLYCTGSNLKNTLSIDDSIDSTARNVTVSATKDSSGNAMGVIHGLPGGGDVEYAHAQTAGPVVISGGSGGNTFTVAAADPTSGGVATSVGLTLNLGSGNDSATIKTNAVTVNGQGGNDTVTVDYSTITVSGAGTFGPGNVTFDGGANADTLSVLGKMSSQAFGVIATAVTQGAQTITFSNVESMALANGAFALANDLNGLNLSLSGSGTAASLSTSQHLGIFSVTNSAMATLASSASAWGKTIFAGGLSLIGGGTLDLTNNALQVSYISDPAATIRGYLLTGYSNAAWTGAGLRSSTAAGAAKPNVYSLGLGDSADGVVAGLPANTLVVRYTVVGDANLDGVDNYTDALKLQANFNHTNANWDQADFSYDGVVNSVDAILLARNYLAVLPATAAPATVTPAPTTTPTPTLTSTIPASTFPATTPTPTPPASTPIPNSNDDRDNRNDKHKDHSSRRHGR